MFRIIVLVAIIGMAIVSCGGGNLNGTYKIGGGKITATFDGLDKERRILPRTTHGTCGSFTNLLFALVRVVSGKKIKNY